MRTIYVTKWMHPSFDEVLILRGTAMETRAEAETYAAGVRTGFEFTECEMPAIEFDALPEFAG